MRELTRRELLAAFLGAGVLACAPRGPRRSVPGVIVGGNDVVGHRFRDGELPPAHSSRAVPVVIVGGGVAGLSAAWRLQRAGVTDFELLELDDAAGGTARSGENEVCAYPWGAHYLPVPLPHAKAACELLVELGAAQRTAAGTLEMDEAQLCRAPQERLFHAGRWGEGLYPRAGATAEDRRQLAAFNAEAARLSDLRDGRGRRAFAVPAEHGSDDADLTALDRLSMDGWLRQRGLDSPRLRWFVEYACRDDFGATLSQTSAWAALHYFAARREHGHPQEVLTWPEGNGRLVAHLARACGARARTGTLALRVTPGADPQGSPRASTSPAGGVVEGAGARADSAAEVRTLDVRTGRVESLRAEHVVLAVPRAFAARLLRDEALAAQARTFRMGAWLTANLTLSSAPAASGYPLCWDNVLYDSPGLGYVVATHQLDRPPGRTVWTYYLPFLDDDPAAGRRRLLALTHAEAAEIVLADLSRAHPDLRRFVERLDVWKWGHAMVRPAPGFVFSPERREAFRQRGNVHFAHSDLSALALFEEAQWHGIRAAEEILTARGARFDSLL